RIGGLLPVALLHDDVRAAVGVHVPHPEAVRKALRARRLRFANGVAAPLFRGVGTGLVPGHLTLIERKDENRMTVAQEIGKGGAFITGAAPEHVLRPGAGLALRVLAPDRLI